MKPSKPSRPNGVKPGKTKWRGWARLMGVLLSVALFSILFYFIGRYGAYPGFIGRFYLIPWVVLGIIFAAATNYVQTNYGLKFPQAVRYLIASLFSLRYPGLVVSDGKKNIKPGKVNLLDAIGGPGYLIIQPGSAVLLECLDGLPRVLGPGWHFIRRFETIKEVIGLVEQNGRIEKVHATTKDGIDVVVKDIRYRYRLCADPLPNGDLPRSPGNPYPYSDEAVKNMVYNRTFSRDGITSWDKVIGFAIDGAITDYINQHFLDDVTAPATSGTNPRADICNQLKSSSRRERLRKAGAELVWFDIGHFEVPERVNDQRLSTWGTKWNGDANILRAYGDSQRQAYQEIGRAEAQAEILMSIIHALEDVEMRDGSRQNLRNLILLKTAQILESMSQQEQTRSEGREL